MSNSLLVVNSEQPNALHALIRKRAEIAGKIECLQRDLRQLIVDLDHVDGTIHIFDPDIHLEEIKPKLVLPKHHAFRGEVTRVVLSTLRQADRPVNSTEIALKVMEARNLPLDDLSFQKTMVKRVGACLRHFKQKGVVTSVDLPRRVVGWKLVRAQ